MVNIKYNKYIWLVPTTALLTAVGRYKILTDREHTVNKQRRVRTEKVNTKTTITILAVILYFITARNF